MSDYLSISENEGTLGIRELTILLDISKKIIRTEDYKVVLQIISEGMSELLKNEVAAIYKLESDGTLFLEASTPPLEKGIPDEYRKAFLSDHPHIEKAVSKRKFQLISDTTSATLTAEEKEVIDHGNIKSVLYLPLFVEENVFGVLILGNSTRQRSYTIGEINFGQILANQLTASMVKTKLIISLKNHKDNLEELVYDRTVELETANEELTATNEELNATNEELNKKNNIIIKQKREIEFTLNELKSTQSQLIQSDKMASLGVLTAGVAHEINNPLNFIKGGCEGLEKYCEKKGVDDPEVKQLIQIIKTGVNRSATIVTSLNEFSRDKSYENEKCHIHDIIDNCLLILNNQFKNKVEVHKEYTEDAFHVIGNVGKLHQFFLNILSNANDAIDNEGKVRITTKMLGDWLEITISDTGEGISKENLKKIFEPFFTTKEPGKGTGLGLSIAYSILQSHKGSVEFKSEVGVGTTVKIKLPING